MDMVTEHHSTPVFSFAGQPSGVVPYFFARIYGEWSEGGALTYIEGMELDKVYYFCGIGGTGMSAIAQVLAGSGARVMGSDRNYDRGLHADLFQNLSAQGIQLVAQDGASVTSVVSQLIVSSAVEATIPDVGMAQKLGVPIRKRAELLAELFNHGRGIAVGGTSGKSTVTGMIGYVLHAARKEPTVVSGGKMRNFEDAPMLGNAITGTGAIVIEADESDGTIALYEPRISVLTNVSFDHMPLDELVPLFTDYCGRADDVAIVNADCEMSMAATDSLDRVTFGIDADADYRATSVIATPDGMSFAVNNQSITLPLPGKHNVSNALAAIAACAREGVGLKQAGEALASFKGIARRLEVLGTAGGVTVIDDFAHNPDKLSAAIAALKAFPGRLHVMFQPHGFGPTKMLRKGIVAAFAEGLSTEDCLWMPEIFYAGGTADRSISSADLIDEVTRSGISATFVADRDDLGDRLIESVVSGDRIAIMGARDDSLTTFGLGLLNRLSERRK
jgi:UDP-N-acetylmuramate--alanine ligase